MNVRIQPLNNPQGPCWQVSFGNNRVSFRSEAEARQFVATLEARLRAPHPLPAAAARAAG
ncbi:hypothetical protein I0D00_18980 [Pseudomonas lalucatii]|uniref:DUF2188 domain-containing protein n=1 Tax=Pseudomonas lalucatii TaxID=1424203 RepID=A0ABS5Q5F6_9PSED|nr:hypothetical protein [Pseudomonas lalucatii]